MVLQKLSLGHRFRESFKARSRASSPIPSSSSSTTAVTAPIAHASTSSSVHVAPSSIQSPIAPVASDAPTASAASSRRQSISHSSTSHDLLHRTLQRLSDDERATLQDHFYDDIDLALENALTATKEKQRCCIEKRWTFTLAGRSVTLREEAEKVVRWLNRFKSVGDIAINVDPVHVGLPWAGIRLLLEVLLGFQILKLKSDSYVLNRLPYPRRTKWLRFWSDARPPYT